MMVSASFLYKWKPVTVDEMKGFIAVVLSMGNQLSLEMIRMALNIRLLVCHFLLLSESNSRAKQTGSTLAVHYIYKHGVNFLMRSQ